MTARGHGWVVARPRYQLALLGACDEALLWVGDKTFKEAWSTCERGDWMLWYAHRVGVSTARISFVAHACVDSAPANDNIFASEGHKNAKDLAHEAEKDGWRGEHALYAAQRTCWRLPSYTIEGYAVSDDDGSYSADRAALNAKFADIVRKHITLENLICDSR